jgi:hypothetical protein
MEKPTAWRKNGGLRKEKTAKLLGEKKLSGDIYPTCLTIM